MDRIVPLDSSTIPGWVSNQKRCDNGSESVEESSQRDSNVVAQCSHLLIPCFSGVSHGKILARGSRVFCSAAFDTLVGRVALKLCVYVGTSTVGGVGR